MRRNSGLSLRFSGVAVKWFSFVLLFDDSLSSCCMVEPLRVTLASYCGSSLVDALHDNVGIEHLCVSVG